MPVRLLAGAAAAAAALTLALALPEADDSGAYARAELHGMPGAYAVAELIPKDEGTRVRLRVRGLPRARRAVYELWCVRTDGRWVSGGTFHARGGSAESELNAAVRPGEYHRIVVTVAAGETRRGRDVLHGRLRH